jgi:signal peptidase II
VSDRPWRLAGALCGVLVAVDQASKAAIEANLVPGERVDALGPLVLTLSHNTGIAFGIAGGGGAAVIVSTLAALSLIVYLFWRDPGRPWMWVAVGLLAGGALGNLADRVREGAVTDFIDLPLWPPFNIADMAITGGVALLAFLYLRESADGD